MKKIALIVGIISVAIIAFQLSLMRILSVIQFHHFAYMIISVALLGFGAAGTFLSIFRERAVKYFDTVIFLASFFCSVTILLSTVLIHYLRFEPFLIFWEFTTATSLLLFYIAILLPFFFGAVVICLSFMKYSEYIGEIYFYNLFGSALGGVCTIGLMWWLDPLTLPYTVAFLSLVSAFLGFIFFHLNRKYVLPLALLLIIIIYGFVNPVSFRVSEYKSLSKTLNLPDAKIIEEKISPMAKLTTVESSALRYAPGLSFGFMGEIPVQVGLFSDGEWVGTILKDNIFEKTDFLNFTTSALPYYLFRSDTLRPNVLVIGAGTGTELRLASQNESKDITGIELNPQVIEISEKYLDLSSAENITNIRMIAAEGRGYLIQIDQKYDIIAIPILEGFTASVAGMHSLYENYLFTLESISLMIKRLNDDGILAINCWLNIPPRHAVKLFATLVESAGQTNIKNPEKHIAVIRSWGTVTLLLKKSQFSEDEINAIRKFCDDNYFDAVYFPGISGDQTNIYNQLDDDYFYKSAIGILSDKRNDFYDEYIFNIEPASDDKPYFSHFLKLKSLNYLTEVYGKESVSNVAFYELGYVVLLITFFQIIGISILLIIIPLLFLKKERFTVGEKLRTLIYFAGLGIGFMFIEIVMIQKFILFLSHPVYSVSVVITSLLLFSGIGSWFSHKIFITSRHKHKIIIGSLIAITLIYHFILPVVFESLIHFPLYFKYVVSILLIAPQAFFMGMPFPLGLTKLSENLATLVPWAWGINGCLSVVSAVTAPLVAMEFGFNAVILIAAFSYAGAAIVGIKFKG
ncbi:MAG: hypothetical protein KJ963_02425 [Bacteroidetes bacterium]|nr:hypothetical protein [Bacteroidota bacterium]